jgi:hypothetical protein
MATTTTCDRCGKALPEYEQYKVVLQTIADFLDEEDEEYDLCSPCKDEMREIVENFIYPKEEG